MLAEQSREQLTLEDVLPPPLALRLTPAETETMYPQAEAENGPKFFEPIFAESEVETEREPDPVPYFPQMHWLSSLQSCSVMEMPGLTVVLAVTPCEPIVKGSERLAFKVLMADCKEAGSPAARDVLGSAAQVAKLFKDVPMTTRATKAAFFIGIMINGWSC